MQASLDIKFARLFSKINPDLLVSDNFSFREQIIAALAEVYGYQNIDFWMADSRGRLFDPVTSISSDFINEYQRTYFRQDFLHPFQLGVKKCITNDILTMEQVTDKRTYENSTYCQFLRNYGLYHELVGYLKTNEELTGCIAILRPESEHPFNLQDYINMKVIANILSSMIKLAHLYTGEHTYEEFFVAFSDQSKSGVVIFETPLKIHYCNNMARDLCKQLSYTVADDESVVAGFIRGLLQYQSLRWVYGFTKTFYLPGCEAIRVSVMPASAIKGYLVQSKI
jgi:hypothetical protein